jgi:hypothetical protein
MPVTVAVRSEAWVLAGWLLGSWVPAQGMDVCPRLSVLCCPVEVEAMRRADHSSKESYHMSKQFKKPPICEAAKVVQGL